MDFLELAKKRYSVRNYLDKKVEKEKLEKIIEAAHVAPTAANRQPQRLLVIESEEGISKLKKGANIYNANFAILVCTDRNRVWVRPQDKKEVIDIDASIITDHMMLMATELGLGTLWMTWFDPAVIKKEFNLPSNYEPVNILLIGYAATEPQSPDRHNKTRLPISETVFYESFN